MRRIFPFVFAVLLAGCASTYTRAARQLGQIDGLAYSNSPVVIEERLPRHTPAGPEVHYDVLLANQASYAVTVELAQASVTVDGEPGTATATCGIDARFRTGVELAPRARARVRCLLRLTPTGLSRLGQGDRDLRLSLPVRAPAGSASLPFAYALRMEDAS